MDTPHKEAKSPRQEQFQRGEESADAGVLASDADTTAAEAPMKRSPSCLRRKDLHANLSVTIVSCESLPSYSSERFFLLSEMEQHAAKPVLFLDSLQEDETNTTKKDTNSPVVEKAVLETTTTQEEDVSATTGDSAVLFSSHLLLYLLLPQTTLSVDEVVETIVVPQLQRLQHHVHVSVPEKQQQSKSTTQQLPPAHVYLVVDRVVSVDDNDSDDYATALAKAIACHPDCRAVLAGVTIATSNHPRATPGLEACYQAMAVTGARDRRRTTSPSARRSLLQLVTPHGHHIVPRQEEEPEAAENVVQSRVTAEWQGRGTLHTFAHHAHEAWRHANGLSCTPTTTMGHQPHAQGYPRRVMKRNHTSTTTAMTVESVYDMVAVMMFVAYVIVHFW